MFAKSYIHAARVMFSCRVRVASSGSRGGGGGGGGGGSIQVRRDYNTNRVL